MTEASSGRAELRLRILNALPQRHRDFFVAEVRASCEKFIASSGVKVADRETETLELFSEVMAKLLGATSRHDEPEDGRSGGALVESPSQPEHLDPKSDGRVIWLINEVGGPRALSHRYEDMRRRQWGRWQSSGYRTVQISALQGGVDGQPADEEHILARIADGSVELQSDPYADRELDDMRLAWQGLLILAQKQFKPDDDVGALLQVLDRQPGIQDAFGSAWPITQLVECLNAERPVRPWTEDRVDNAKRRLRGWIDRLRRSQNLDRTDLLALLVHAARRRNREQKPPATPAPDTQSQRGRDRNV